MEAEIKDYLHLYLGHPCQTPDGIMILSYIKTGTKWPVWFYSECNPENKDVLTPDSLIGRGYAFDEVLPILRPLKDLTNVEWNDLCKNVGGVRAVTCGDLWKGNAEETIYFLSKGFDLFDLIPKGLAIAKPAKP